MGGPDITSDRISEATTLEIGAIDRANLVLRIVGKGNKERLAPLPQPLTSWVAHPSQPPLAVPQPPRRRAAQPGVLECTFAAAAAAADIRRDVTPHTLRHSYAT